MVSKKVFVSFGLALSLVGCADPPSEDWQDVPPSLQLQGPSKPEQKLLTRSCGNEGDHMIASFTSVSDAFACDYVTINGVRVNGTKSFNEEDDRWTLGFLIPKGTTSGDVIVMCNGREVNLGRLEVPCPLLPPSGNAFESWGGELKMAQGCDDNDYTVSIGSFTPDTFVMTGLGTNGPITFRLTDANVAEADGVVQYGIGGHKVKLTLDRTSGKIHFSATSPEGSCSSTLSR